MQDGIRANGSGSRTIGPEYAAANLEPERCIDAFAGDINAQKDLLSAHKIVSVYGVKGIKEELARRHGTSTVCR